jgi:hypothetical protein
MTTAWAWWHQQSGPDDYRIRELLRAVWDLHAMYGVDDPWLWRGQANASFRLEPGMHTRVRRHAKLEDAEVERFTRDLIKVARDARLDRHEGARLTDMALLALLQHHRAATPLLDVTLDPIIGLYMAVVSPDPADDEQDGVLFAIRRPQRSITDFDSRSFNEIYATLQDDVVRYTAPNVSERLSIQRGQFLLGPVSLDDSRATIPLTLDPRTPIEQSWIWKRMRNRGTKGKVPAATKDVAAFRITAKFKPELRRWLEERSGLTADFIYPTPWHQPHLERFAAGHGRMSHF